MHRDCGHPQELLTPAKPVVGPTRLHLAQRMGREPPQRVLGGRKGRTPTAKSLAGPVKLASQLEQDSHFQSQILQGPREILNPFGIS